MYAWEQIQQTLDYLEGHLAEEVDIESLAKLANLSPFYFQRLFSRLVKKPVAEYVKLRRMAKAAEALRDREKRILDVALELGFASHEHFTRTFKAAFGMTPEEYRRSPCTLNRMTKPELLLQYVIVDEGVPLITHGMVLEVGRRRLEEPVRFLGMRKKMPVQFTEGLGTESGTDPLGELWDSVHAWKEGAKCLDGDEEIGVTLPCEEEGFFYYFAGTKMRPGAEEEGFLSWELEPGDYIACSFEAENFESLVTDVLYKAEDYLFSGWLPAHGVETEPVCVERYPTHGPETTSMEVWTKLKRA